MKFSSAQVFILATILIDAIGIGLIFPIMPDLMDHVGASSTADGAFLGGILMAAYAAMQFLGSPVIGGLSDSFGRRPVLIASLAALVVDYVIMAVADTFALLLIGRMLAGIAGASYVTAMAYLADISPPEERSAKFGLVGATFGVGFVIGPALGGLVSSIDLSAPFWLAALLSAVNVLFGIFVLPESLPDERRRKMTRRDFNPFGVIFDAVRIPGIAVPLLILFVFHFATMVYPTVWSFWLREAFGWSATMIGLSLAAYGVGAALSQSLVLGALVKRLGDYRTLWLALVCCCVALLGYGVANQSWMVFAILIPACLGDMTMPLATAMSANLAEEDRQGVVQGVIASMGAITAVVAPLIVTSIFQTFASDGAPLYLPGAPYLFGLALTILILPLVPRLRQIGQRKETA
ncbi:MAG TPA: TCR/Tet family MFS transporter [Paracoccaceae bacterium]|nr:TCR/Tet family MFS transporter [Paracoccaceae bacterium]